MKKAEIFARVINKWPEGAYKLDNFQDGEIVVVEPRSYPLVVVGYMDSVIHDDFGSVVTREQWESERARIELSNDIRETVVSDLEDLRNIGLATDEEVNEAKRIASNRQATQEARDIAQGESKRSKEDRALWDKVFLDSQKMIFDAAGDRECLDDIAYRVGKWVDAFMAERAKRLDNSRTTNSTT